MDTLQNAAHMETQGKQVTPHMMRPMPEAFMWAPHLPPAPTQLLWGLFQDITLLKAKVLCYSLRS